LIGSVAVGYLLNAPAIAVRIAEEDKTDVIQVVSFSAWATGTPVVHLYLARIHVPLDETGARSTHV